MYNRRLSHNTQSIYLTRKSINYRERKKKKLIEPYVIISNYSRNRMFPKYFSVVSEGHNYSSSDCNFKVENVCDKKIVPVTKKSLCVWWAICLGRFFFLQMFLSCWFHLFLAFLEDKNITKNYTCQSRKYPKMFL